MKIVVVGPESSGTRLMARILEAAGAEVLHRSFPWGGDGPHDPRHWPEPDIHEFNPDYMVWISRDWWATVPSQVNAKHVDSYSQAWNNVNEATQRIAKLMKDYRTLMVNYESLIIRPQNVVRNLTQMLNLKMPTLEPITDANIKWLENN